MMKAVSGALVLVVFLGAPLSGCGQKGPLFLPGEAPESQTDGPFGLDRQDGAGENRQSSPVPAGEDGDGADETLVPPANTPLPDRLTSPLGTP